MIDKRGERRDDTANNECFREWPWSRRWWVLVGKIVGGVGDFFEI